VALELELEAALLELDDDDDGVVAIGRGSVVESVAVDGVSVEVPLVITDPVIGMGVAIRVDAPDPRAEVVVIVNCGLALPESPITART
jgi:hypothetical protein